MAKQTADRFTCSECQHTEPKWRGQCPECGSWNTFEENGDPGQGKPLARKGAWVKGDGKPVKVTEARVDTQQRVSTGIGELDRVLGETEFGDKVVQGMVPGEVVLIAGEPGIGKSTLLSQVAFRLARTNGVVIYASGEESVQQIKQRHDRLKANHDNLYLLPEVEVGKVAKFANELKPCAIIVDSIQTMQTDDCDAAPGTITQIRESTSALMHMAKEWGITIFIVGHVTKDGNMAGPKMLEHMVDCVLSFEGERSGAYRILRAVKNRFGSTLEIGVFEMAELGLQEVPNPSEVMLAGRHMGGHGSVVVPIVDGTRPMLVELQALATVSGGGSPVRSCNGVDEKRTKMLIAAVDHHAGVELYDKDVYINVVGGMRVQETGVDLAIAIAVASSVSKVPVDPDSIVIGEIGLSGEVRAVNNIDRKLNEAARMGFTRAIIPSRCKHKAVKGLHVVKVDNVRQAIGAALDSSIKVVA